MQHDLSLATHGVRLRPLSPAADGPALHALVDTDMWAGMSQPLPPTAAAMRDHLATLAAQPASYAFGVEHDGRFVGRTTLYDIVLPVRAEIGNTIYARHVWGTTVNPAVKLLLFTLAFDELGLTRVALRCDARNTRSHRAIARLGATYEGTLRAFRPAADGTIADVDYFSVLAAEWPTVRAGLLARLGTAA